MALSLCKSDHAGCFSYLKDDHLVENEKLSRSRSSTSISRSMSEHKLVGGVVGVGAVSVAISLA